VREPCPAVRRHRYAVREGLLAVREGLLAVRERRPAARLRRYAASTMFPVCAAWQTPFFEGVWRNRVSLY
jgi:hypothetical protein